MKPEVIYYVKRSPYYSSYVGEYGTHALAVPTGRWKISIDINGERLYLEFKYNKERLKYKTVHRKFWFDRVEVIKENVEKIEWVESDDIGFLIEYPIQECSSEER